MELTQSTIERFWAKVDKSDNCWIWKASIGSHGGGQLNVNGKPELAYRISWLIHFGAIPDGMSVCHKCDNRACVNPDHLFLGDHKVNMHDMIRKGRGVMNRPNVMQTNPEKRHYGERNGQAKLTANQVREIRLAFASGTSMPQLATQFGITRHAIGRVVRRQAWAHVE